MLGGSEGLILIAVIVLLFGGSQIPKLAKNLGLAQKELREGMKSGDDSADASSSTQNA